MKSGARRELCRHLARFARKTGRRLTSDPIRTSLGLLPSGPDPVGEWLVHRQSPGPYLGPKGPESKRGWRVPSAGTTPVLSWQGIVVCLAQTTYTCLRSRPSTSCFSAAHKKGVDARVIWRENALLPGHDGELFAGLLSARLLQNRETLDAL